MPVWPPWQTPPFSDGEPLNRVIQAPPNVRTVVRTDAVDPAAQRQAVDLAEQLVNANAGAIQQFFQQTRAVHNLGGAQNAAVSRELPGTGIGMRYQNIQGSETLFLTVTPAATPPASVEVPPVETPVPAPPSLESDLMLDWYLGVKVSGITASDPSISLQMDCDAGMSGQVPINGGSDPSSYYWIVAFGRDALRSHSTYDATNPNTPLLNKLLPGARTIPSYPMYDGGTNTTIMSTNVGDLLAPTSYATTVTFTVSGGTPSKGAQTVIFEAEVFAEFYSRANLTDRVIQSWRKASDRRNIRVNDYTRYAGNILSATMDTAGTYTTPGTPDIPAGPDTPGQTAQWVVTGGSVVTLAGGTTVSYVYHSVQVTLDGGEQHYATWGEAYPNTPFNETQAATILTLADVTVTTSTGSQYYPATLDPAVVAGLTYPAIPGTPAVPGKPPVTTPTPASDPLTVKLTIDFTV